MVENQNVEFLEVCKDKYFKVISSFANAQGGKLYIGFSDDGNIKGLRHLECKKTSRRFTKYFCSKIRH